MSTETNQIQSNVAQVELDLDEIFNGTPSGDSVTLPDPVESKKSIFQNPNQTVDMSFADPDGNPDLKEIDDLSAGIKEGDAKKLESVNDIIDSLDFGDDVPEGEDKKRGRKAISGISDVFSKLIKEDKIVPFDDEKSLDDYTAKDWEELIDANLEEKANQVRRETPKQFFDSLPQELQIAARYVADGGQDLKGLFMTLGQVEETRELDVRQERDQEVIIREYLGATGFGNQEEIQEEIDTWKDLGKLQQQASKFKPKLDKMQEQVVMQKIQEQDLKKKQQQNASQEYMENVYNTLKDGQLGDLKIDRKVQTMLYNGLVQPNYPSVSGRNTNLLGHLLEKYQFVEPNHSLISEALWLLADEEGYKAKIMEKGADKSIEATVRKLKTEQANIGGSSSLENADDDDTRRPTNSKKLPRSNNIFKRF